MARPQAWSTAEDARLIELREQGLTGYELHSLFENRSVVAVKNRLVLLRNKRVVR